MQNIQDSQEMIEQSLENALLTVKQDLQQKRLETDIFINHSSIELNIKKSYSKIATDETGILTAISKNDLPNDLKTNIPVPFFGKNDFENGFINFKQNNPLQGWIYSGLMYGINGKDNLLLTSGNVLPYTYKPISQSKNGDLILFFRSQEILNNSGFASPIYFCEVVISVSQGGYGALLNSLNYKPLPISGIRMKVLQGKESQFYNDLKLIKQDQLGKISNDSVTPQVYQQTQSFNLNIVDIPLQTIINAELLLSTYMNFDLDEIQFLVSIPELQILKK